MRWRQVLQLSLGGLLLLATATAPAEVRADDSDHAAATLSELRKVQTKVAAVVKRVLPTVVAIRAGGGQGSGVVVSADGYVLTASHVVADADRSGGRVDIIFPDGETVPGRVVERQQIWGNDTALVRIISPAPEGGFAFAPIGRSAYLTGGQWCIAAGHPGGYREDRPPVIRLGRILFNGQRTIVSDNTLIGGDSGGPLFDLDGNVIGIHSRIGENAADNKHVPIDLFIEHWVQYPFVDPVVPIIGVATNEPEVSARVDEISPRSAAEKAGIRPGDVIVRFNDEDTPNFYTLQEAVGQTRPGDVVDVELIRPGMDHDVTVKLTVGSREEVRHGW